MREKQYLMLFPWLGGLNTTLDPAILDPKFLTQADDIIYSTSGSRRKRGGQAHLNNSTAIKVGTVTQTLFWGTEYWATVSNAKRQYLVAASDEDKFLRSQNGITWSSFNTNTISLTHGKMSSVVFNNDLIIGHGTNTASVPLCWVNQNTANNLVKLNNSTATGYVFSAVTPLGWIVQTHRNRLLVAGEAANPDRVYYSAPIPDEDTWYSPYDHGYVDVFPNDGDSEGITALFPEINRGGLYVAKRTKIYYVDTSSPDSADWSIELVSDGIGCLSHNSAKAVDQADVIFASDRGIHSLRQILSGTAIKDGDYLSREIQTDWDTKITAEHKPKMSAVWIPQLNSYLFSCKTSDQPGSSTLATHRLSTLATVYGYDFDKQGWFRWTLYPSNFLFTRFNTTTKKQQLLSLGKGYINTYDNETKNDFKITIPTAATFAGYGINARMRTAIIYPGGVLPGEKHFTNLVFIIRDRTECDVDFQYRIDDQPFESGTFRQTLGANNILGTTLLGSTYILGTAAGRGLKPIFSNSGDTVGVGHTIDIIISQDDIDKDLELFGLGIEYTPASESQNPRRLLGS